MALAASVLSISEVATHISMPQQYITVTYTWQEGSSHATISEQERPKEHETLEDAASQAPLLYVLM